MSLVEEYYELNEALEVSPIWKVVQIILYATAACTGLACGFTLAILRIKFDDRCYLFTKVKSLDQSSINWTGDNWCDYYQFSMVASFIVAIIWATFFLMCGKGGKSITGFVLWGRGVREDTREYQFARLSAIDFIMPGKINLGSANSGTYQAMPSEVTLGAVFLPGILLPQPWRIVWPSLLFNFTYFGISLSTAISIQHGTDIFCGRSSAQKYLTNSRVKSLTDSCEPLIELLKNNIEQTLTELEVVTKTGWFCSVSWFLLFLLPLFRILFVVDFQLYKICVFKIDDAVQNKREEILRITNYEEPKKLHFEVEEERTMRQTEDKMTDLEAGTRKRFKVDKKSTRQHFHFPHQSSITPTATFYMSEDLRMLRRGRKRDRSPASLDESFGKNKVRLESKKPRSHQSNLHEIVKPKPSSYIFPVSRRTFHEGAQNNNDDDDYSSDSTNVSSDTSSDFSHVPSRSESVNEIYDDSHSKYFLRLKKEI